MTLPKNFLNINSIITNITLYKNNVNATRKFSFGTWTSRQHIFIEIESEGKYGYGENIISVNEPDISMTEWCEQMKELKGKTITQAMEHLRGKMNVWRDRLTEMAEMCLIDLAGKVLQKSAVELLGLQGTRPVYGVHVILSDDLDFVTQQARWAVENNKAKFIKVKLFGRPSLDRAIIKAVRKESPRDKTYLIGDVNGGYRMRGECASIEEIACNLNSLYNAGLDACEDPAYIDTQEWVALQGACGPLALIPDYPMRPASVAMETIVPNMGRIYNIHPGSAGSVLDAICLAGRIRQLDAQLMIGDDSLIGPGCTIWQQLAIGLDAAWVEAIEKPSDSDGYLSCVKALGTDSSAAAVALQKNTFGFGIVLDKSNLAAIASEVYDC